MKVREPIPERVKPAGFRVVRVGLRFALKRVGEDALTYRIHRSMQPGTIVFALSGVLDTELAVRLQALIASEAHGDIVLDLTEITLVDRAAVRFLAGVEAAGTKIVNCPEYVRTWIAAENDSQ